MPAEFFFTLAMRRRLLTNFSLRRFDLVLGPALHRLPPQKPHFLDNPLFDRVGLLEISLRIRYRHRYRYESIAKTRVRLKNCRKRRVAVFRRRHLPSLLGFQTESLLRITLNRTRWAEQGVMLYSEFRDGNVPAGHEQ